ncbi:outer membrane beta-barrel protein [Winogradskyella litorisediminis]|uniref:Outer membrane beta-barrel protein n=1 Tax=Winogradskyella litorisediminis TaxID=1156618 RepID=A0ABW3N657_9FLAO
MRYRCFLVLILFCLQASNLYAQEKGSNPFNLSPYAGLSTPQSSFKNIADNGFGFGLAADKYVTKRLAFGLDFNYQTFAVKNPIDFNALPGSFAISENTDKNFTTTSITVGPTYKIGSGKFTTELYGKAGISFVNSPTTSASINMTEVFNTKEESSTAFGLTTGVRFNYNVSPKISLFVNPQFNFSGSEINYQTRDFTIILADGPGADDQIDFEQDFNDETVKTSSIGINAGIKINLGGSSKDKDEPDSVFPPFCEIVFNNVNCKYTTPYASLTVNWSGYNPNFAKLIEVYDTNNNIVNTSIVGNNTALGGSAGSFTGSATLNGHANSTLTAVFKVMDYATGNIVCTSPVITFQVPPCIAPYTCDFEIDPNNYSCDSNGITYSGVVTWSNAISGSTIDILATNQNANSVPLIVNPNNLPIQLTTANGNLSGTASYSITIPNTYSGNQITLISRISNPNTGFARSCGGADVLVPTCVPSKDCELNIDQTAFTCDANTVTFTGVTTSWANHLVGSTITLEATQNGVTVPVTSTVNFPYVTTATTGNISYDITIPNSYGNSNINISVTLTDPTTGQPFSCGIINLAVPQCPPVKSCGIDAEPQSCLFNNGKTELNFVASLNNYNNPSTHTASVEIRDLNNTVINIPITNNNNNLNANGKLNLSGDFSNYTGESLIVIVVFRDSKGTIICSQKITFDIPMCCIDCDGVVINNTTPPNQVGNQFVVDAVVNAPTDIEKIVVKLDYTKVKDIPNTRLVTPVNFEFLSTSRIDNNPVQLTGSLSGFRSTMIIQDISPLKQSVPLKLLIDNYYNKEMIQYRIKVTVHMVDGQFCEQYIPN